jgi:LysR family transcriptional regulator, pca operon transcriptional activator
LLSFLGLQPPTSLRSSSYGFIREMLHATDLISVMPRLMMVGDLLRGTLRVVPLPAPDRPAGLILPRDRVLSPAGQAFVQCLRAFVTEIEERGVADIAGGYSGAKRSDTTRPGNSG